jgi:hypothetical protein
VQDVEAEQERDLEPGLARQRLGPRHVPGGVEVEHRPDPALRDFVPLQRRSMGDEIQLAEFFLEGHASEKVVDLAFDLRLSARTG